MNRTLIILTVIIFTAGGISGFIWGIISGYQEGYKLGLLDTINAPDKYSDIHLKRPPKEGEIYIDVPEPNN